MHYTKLASGDNLGIFCRIYSDNSDDLIKAKSKLMNYKWSNIDPVDIGTDNPNQHLLVIYTRKGITNNFNAVSKLYPSVYIQLTVFSIIYGYEYTYLIHKGEMISYTTSCLPSDDDKYYYVWGDKDLLYMHGFIEFDNYESYNIFSLNSNYVEGYDSLESVSSGNPYSQD